MLESDKFHISPFGSIRGAANGCPFCRAVRSSLPEIGTRFRFLSGFRAGKRGTIVQSPAPYPWPQNECVAQLDGEPASWQSRVLPEDILEFLPAPAPPAWLPPIELRAASDFDAVVVKFCDSGATSAGWHIHWTAYFEVVRFVWWKRLPIKAEEVWAVLQAHGVPVDCQGELSNFFSQGRDLLVYSAGRKPIKKRRVRPLSSPYGEP